MNYYDFKKIKKELNKKINKKYRINYLNINSKIKNINNIVFLINAELLEIQKLNKVIKFIKIKYFIENKKINIIFIYNKSKKLIDYFILKNIFKKNNILGKIIIKKNNNYVINKKIINKINLLNN